MLRKLRAKKKRGDEEEEVGNKLVEYGLIAGLVFLAAVALMTAVGAKVIARWTSINSSL